MTDEAKNTTTEASAEAPAPKGKSSLIKYALMGVAGLVLVVAIAFGTLMILGAGSTPSSENAPAEATAQAPSADSAHTPAVRPQAAPGKHSDSTSQAAAQQAEGDSALAGMDTDQSMMDEIMKNLAVLDYKPTDKDTSEQAAAMSAEDSAKAANWLAGEKERLAKREKELDARERKLNELDAKVSQQMLKVEQAESTRITKLAKLYDGMEPRAVAQLAANLDDATVVALLPRMNIKNASQVLALMPPVRAARLSKQMITIAEN